MPLVAFAYNTDGSIQGDGGPIRLVTGGSVILTEIGGFNTHSLTFALGELDDSGTYDAERLIDALAPWTLIRLVQEPFTSSIPGDDGTLGWGYVLNPRQQITDRDEHTITLELHPITDELRDHRVHRGWQAQNKLSVIASRIGSFTPGWAGTFTDAGTANDITVLVTTPDTTPLDLFLSTATQFSQYARQGVDPYGVPTRVLEMGQFGAPPVVTLTSGNGGDAEAMAANGTVRIPATIDRSPADVTNLMTTCTPFGGGSSTDTMVTLERPWRIINDPTYPGYGRYGTDAQSIARTGQVSLFPEYDPAYPISDPEHPASGQRTYLERDNTIVSPAPGFATDAQIVAAGGQLLQGAVGTRYFTLDGHSDYMVYDAAAYALYGHHDREFMQPQITYTSNAVADQELSARALYMSAIANFKRFAHPHHTFACTVANANGRVTRAGDLIAVDYQRATSGLVEMDIDKENLIVMRVTRNFQGENPAYDDLLLSNLGRFDRDDPAGSAASAKAILALQINQNTTIAPLSIDADGNTDNQHPLVRPKRRPVTLFRWHVCQLRVDPLPFTGTADTTSDNPVGTPIIAVGGVDIELPTPNDINLGGTFNAAGTGATGTTDGFDLVQRGVDNDAVIKLQVTNDGDPNLGSSPGNNLRVYQSGAGYILKAGIVANSSGGAQIQSTINFPKAKTQSAFTAPINKLVKAAQSVIAHIPAGTKLADLTQHVHKMIVRIPNNGPTASVWDITIGGQSIPLGVQLTSGTRNADGTFSGSVEFADLSALMNGLPTDDFTIVVTPHTDGGNPFGASYFTVTGIFLAEYGGFASTIIAS
jgi:hypothetical protein